ncbi:P-loop NTPase fold protein [uncultured Ruegeria sp.]|uniref:KAP family P-loop NTPase fold protein n=1 Tax=uncultured Ruegeria sp. TaxID=259304 RepID=UPI0026352DCB|nr:P-loop NTPase fold protein [uncultured Ruegeria sp.]
MQRLTIPEPKIKLYEDGFADHDKLSRKATGDKLSELVERIDDPLVIALDGAWGSGKSIFLKCWVGEHLKRAEETQTVYFDAYKHDYLDDPLVALTGAIAHRFRTSEDKQQEENEKRTQNLKKTAWAVSKAAGRIGLSAVTFGATEILSDLGDEIAQPVGEEAKAFLSKETGDKQADQFWDAHQAKIAAMGAFRLALADLTEPKSENGVDAKPTKKLVIVVDELDRCRPDYALSLLETIKHFFDVEGVHFVLGVNLTQPQNSVKARYGSGTEAEAYLQKFYSLQFKLPNRIQYTQDYVHYFNYASGQMQLPRNAHGVAHDLLERYVGPAPITPRTIQRILTVVALIPFRTIRDTPYEFLLLPAILKVCAPAIYEKIRKMEIELEDLQLAFRFEGKNLDNWIAALNATEDHNEVFPGSARTMPDNFLASICEDYLEVFDSRSLEID